MVGDFRFQVGDLVCLGTDLVRKRAESSPYGSPVVAIRIVERMTQECYGGVQRHYRLRGFFEGRESILTLTEPEVEAYPMPVEPEQAK